MSDLSHDLVRRRVALRRQNQTYAEWPPVEMPKNDWPFQQMFLVRVYRSRDFLIQVFNHGEIHRLSICRTVLDDRGRFSDGISWDDLQRIKNACGFQDQPAVEVFPPQKDIVNVANFRHLWIVPERLLPFMWKNQQPNPGIIRLP